MALDLPRQDILEALSTGQIQLTGEFTWGSNYTYLAEVGAGSTQLQAVYKPAAGERPLWDFPPRTLARREVAAYLTSSALGWDLVPPTVLREDGPAGGGSLQLYLDLDRERHYFNFSPRERKLLAPAALFDALINNADRKAGHVLLDPQQHVWLIDHGVCFHQDDKLRTVIWDFAGQPIAAELLHDLERVVTALAAARRSLHEAPSGTSTQDPDLLAECLHLVGLLSEAELEALAQRARRLIEAGCYPTPGAERHYPWPLI